MRLTDPHLDTINRIKVCILMNVIVPKFEYEYAGEV